MSYTEIYGFSTSGDAYLYGEVKNAWRGGMAIWNILEERYLPQYRPSYVPNYIPDDRVEDYLHYKPSRCGACMDDGAMKEIWKLFDDERLKDCEKIALASTFDRVIVIKENLPKLVAAFREFDGQTSLKEQADIIEKMVEDDDCIAIGFNQTSVNSDTWANFGGYDEETDEYLPYNILDGDKHWELFSDFNEG
ncbi:hypothetical protein [Desulfitobacterium hafniense]|uniref:hypothetical protein n=1 Tax=Desulfitobacterium hafniense TaxID=49338 RepID=UPI00059E74BD|nr:hypothetical protein [Desulfitobacterium hafniense]